MEEKKIDWEQRRYELAKAAMQALISNSFFMKNLGMYLDEHPDKKMDAIEVVAIESINYTDVLIKKLKDTMFVDVQNNRSSGRVVPPLAAGRSPTDD